MYCTAPLSPRKGRLISFDDDDDDDDDAEVSEHFGSIPLLPKCLAAEMSYCRSVRTPAL